MATKRPRNGKSAHGAGSQDGTSALAALTEALGEELAGMDDACAQLASAENERAALSDEMKSAATSVVTSIEESTVAVQSLARAQVEVSGLAKLTQEASEGNATALRELAASLGVMRKDTGSLTESAESTAATLEQLARSLKGVDRKSTRLNSSHVEISYAVFCLKKKLPITHQA